MKKVLFFALAFSFAVPGWALAQVRALGVPYQGLQASLVPSKTSYKSDDPVVLDLILTNVSEEAIRIDDWPGDWFVEVTDADNILRPNARASNVPRPAPVARSLKRGERWKTRIVGLTLEGWWEYQPLGAGKYTLVAAYHNPWDEPHDSEWADGVYSQAVHIDIQHV